MNRFQVVISNHEHDINRMINKLDNTFHSGVFKWFSNFISQYKGQESALSEQEFQMAIDRL